MEPGGERESVRVAVRELLRSDSSSGALRPVSHYKNLFPGYWDVVDEEYARTGPPATPATLRAEAAAPAAPPTADRVGHYRLLRELGRGGMGVVWLAEDTRIGRKVALKVLAPGYASSRHMLLRFQREAEAASRLDHPGICPVFEADFEGDTPHIAMRFVEGETLAQGLVAARERGGTVVDLPGAVPAADDRRSTAGGLPPEIERVVAVVEKAARALHAAHEAGLVHRDVKPGNILVGAQGEPTLLDFGLARTDDDDEARLSKSGMLLGTPAYMSPEQLTAQRIQLDRRTDVYSLGVTLFECLTLRLPFEAPTLEGLYQRILATDPEDPRRLNRRIPRDLKVVLETALQKDRNRRYATALDLAEDLRRVREFEPIRARPIGPFVRGWRWARRNPTLATAVVTIYATLLLFVVVLRKWESQAREGQEYLRNSERLATIQRDRAEKERARAEESARRAKEEEARARAALEETDRALRRAGAMRLVAESTALRPGDPELALLLALEGHRRLPGRDARNAVLGALVALREVRAFVHPCPVRDAVLSPDGRRVATVGNDGIARVFDSATGRRLRALGATGTTLDRVLFLGDGSRVAAAGKDGTVHVWDSATGAPVGRTEVGKRATPVDLVARDGGARVLFLVPRGKVHIVDAPAEGAGTVRDFGKLFAAISAALSRDGRFAVGGIATGGASTLDVSEGKVRQLQDNQVVQFAFIATQTVALSPDGSLAATGSGPRNCLFRTSDGTLAATLDTGNECPRALRFSPDGLRVAAALRETVEWEAPGGTVVARFPCGGEPQTCVAFSPDGRLLASGGQDGVVRVWPAAGGAPIGEFRGHSSAVRTLEFSRDGGLLLSTDGGPIPRLWRVGPLPHCVVIGPGSGGEPVVAAAFDGPGARVALVRLDHSAQIADAATGATLATLRIEGTEGAPTPIDALLFPEREPPPGLFAARFLAGGSRVATLGAAAGMRVRIWDAGTGACRLPLPYFTFHYLQRMDVRPDGDMVAVGSLRGRVETYDAKSGTRVAALAKGVMMSGSVPPVAFSPDGTRLASTVDGNRPVIADPRTGEVLVPLAFEGAFDADVGASMQFSLDGARLLGFEPSGRCTVWDAKTGAAFPRADAVELAGTEFACLSGDGRRVLTAGLAALEGTGGVDGVVQLFDAETGKRLLRCAGHTRKARTAEFSPDGRTFVSASIDGTARLWDAESGEELLTLAGHGSAVLEARFSPDGRRVLTASADGTARIWPLDPVAAAEAARPRDLTPEEMERFGIGTPEERAARAREIEGK